jgi:hypothetical protein
MWPALSGTGAKQAPELAPPENLLNIGGKNKRVFAKV